MLLRLIEESFQLEEQLEKVFPRVFGVGKVEVCFGLISMVCGSLIVEVLD